MDENTAWQNFAESGSVSDYLTYCRIKLGYPSCSVGEQAEDKNENGNGSPDIDGYDRWR